MTQQTRAASPPEVVALAEILSYHLADSFPADADWYDFAARVLKELRDRDLDVVRPHLLGPAR